MITKSRTITVWVCLISSMTLGALVLMSLESKAPDGGAFSLASYTKLEGIDDNLVTQATFNKENWSRIEVSFSNTQAGNIDSLALVSNLASSDELNYHFVVCNGKGGENGLIESTTKWRKQYPALPDNDWYGSRKTIRIKVIANKYDSPATDSQVKRVNKLLDLLCQKCDIEPINIDYPMGYEQ